MPSTGVLGAAAVVLALMLTASQLVTAADPSGDDTTGNLVVTIVDPTPTPTASPTPNPGGGSGGGGGRGGGGGGATEEPVPTDDATPPPAAEADHRGILMSGLTTHYQGELNPFGGWARTSVTITNRTDETFNGTVVIRLVTMFGTPLSIPVKRMVDGLRPGQVQRIAVDLPGVGQWPLVEVTADLTPRPATADTATIHREAWVLSFPWLLLVLLVLVIAAIVIVRVSRPEWFERLRRRTP